MMKVSMVKLYNISKELTKERAKGVTTIKNILSKLGINMCDYWQHIQYEHLVIEQNFKEKQIKIKLPYETKNEGGYIPQEIINKYYEPRTYCKSFRLQKESFHNIEIKVTILTKEYIVDLDKLLCEIREELRQKKIAAQNEYDGYCEKMKDLEKKKKRVFNKLTYCADFEDNFDRMTRLY